MNGKTDSRAIPEALLQRLSDYLTARVGLHFAKRNWKELQQKMTAAMTDFGFDRVEEFIESLLSLSPTQNQIEILAGHLTVGETYFFRERKVFEILEQSLLPGLIAARRKTERRLRFWSAGCCTGEEPYSIAILLHKMLPDLKTWNISILATDITPRFLHKASEGIYGKWSFRDCPQWVQEKYFQRSKKDLFEILPEIKNMVTFAYLNLVEDSYPALSNQTNAMDVIFCRNVLMYFAEEPAKKVVHNLSRSLVDEGWLVISPTESVYIPSPPFAAVRFPDAVLYKKDGKLRGAKEIPHLLPPLLSKEATAPARPRVDAALKRDTAPVHEIKTVKRSEAKEKEAEKALPPYVKAQALYEHGRYGEATRELLELVSHDQDTVTVLTLLARTYANQGDLMEARKWCERAIAKDKLVSGLHYLRATILMEQGGAEEAVMSLKRALYLDPDFVLAHFAMGVLNSRRGKLKETEKHFKNVITLLRNCQQEEILPESDGITAGRLGEIVGLIRQEKGLPCVK
jgi:chemotaxis protein methyltransferase CheR